MKISKTHFGEAQILASGIAGILMLLFPGVPLGATLAGIILIWALVYELYIRTGSTDLLGRYTLLAAMLLMCAGVIVNVHYYTVVRGGTLSSPVVISDALTAWDTMESVVNGTDNPWGETVRGYGRFLAGLSYVSGVSISAFLLYNVAFVMVAIVLTGSVAEMLCGASCGPRVRSVAMLFMVLVAPFLYSGTILIKDALMCMLMALFVFSALRLRFVLSGQVRARFPVVFGYCMAIVAVMALAMLVRPNLLPFLAIGAVFVFGSRKWRPVVAGCVIVLMSCAGFVLSQYWIRNAPDAVGLVRDSSTLMTYTEGRIGAFDALTGGYDGSPWYVKLLYLPLTLAAQYLPPLPWNFTRDIVFAPTSVYARIAYGWYFVGGVTLYGLFAALRLMPPVLRRTVLYGVTCWVITAYVTVGTIPRYCLPWLPMITPAAAWVWMTLRKTRGFRVWIAVYAVVLASGLLVCHHLQMKNNLSTEELWKTESR